MYAIEKNRNTGLGVVLLLGFTFFMGAMLGPLLSYTLHFRNGGQLIAIAAGGTGAIFFTLAGIASTTKRDFSNMGKFLVAGAILILVAALANMFFQLPALSLAISVIAILVFSGFILFDINRIVQGGETSYVSATLAVYLDIYNIFASLLQILGVVGGDRD
jgi:FtsH-binding integral membrane protein